MTSVIFENRGEIDARTISTFGVNVKEGDNPIGFFGTGLKYAIAVLLRERQQVLIQSGLATYDFTLQVETIRGKEFSIVYCNGNPLGFTTELGKKWELWMAYRELWCNVKDERGRVYEEGTPPEPTENLTRIIVIGNMFLEEHYNRSSFILEDTPFYEEEGVNIHLGGGHSIFYRGIKVGALKKHLMFTYNITRQIDLTEDRTVKHYYQVDTAVAIAIARSKNSQFLREVLSAPKGSLEHEIDYNGVYHAKSNEFFSTVERLMTENPEAVNQSARQLYKKQARERGVEVSIPLTTVQEKMVQRALHFLETAFKCSVEYEIVVTDSLGGDILGSAENGKIYIAEKAFHQGTKMLAGTIFEEWLHIKTGHEDCTRSMQNYLIDRLMSMGEELTGEPL